MGETAYAFNAIAQGLADSRADAFVRICEFVPTGIGGDTCHYRGLGVLGYCRDYLSSCSGDTGAAIP